MNIGLFTRISLIIGTPIIFALFTFSFLRSSLMVPRDPNSQQIILFEVPPEKSFREISNELQAKGILKRSWSIELISRLKKGQALINSGEYELSASMTPEEVLNKLFSGELYYRTVTLEPGMSIWDLGVLVQQAGLLEASELNVSLASPELLARAGISASSFEGYLYPTTYSFSRPVTARQMIWKMLESGDGVWRPEFSERAYELNLSRHEVLTLASIIEKETSVARDRRLVSSVLHNRLNEGMRLQSNSTVIYGIPDYNGELTQKHLEFESPYNTYLVFGLPPGPIGNPSIESIEAALYPEETSFLFFASDSSGGHVFSTTLSEHQEVLERYGSL